MSNAKDFEKASATYTQGLLTKSFDEQYEYYCSQDTWVRFDAANHIKRGDEMNLSQFPECFEYSDYDRHYEFVSAEGIKKLKENWLSLWKTYELDKYV